MKTKEKVAETDQVMKDLLKEIEKLKNLGDKKLIKELERLEKILRSQ